MNGESSSSRRQDSRNIVRINRQNNRRDKSFERNPNLAYIVHALLHLSEFLTVLAIELFHHLHHFINRKLREKDSNVVELPEERHYIYIVIPFCMVISLILGAIWIFTTNITKKIEVGLVGCLFGAILMLLNAIFSMRHAQVYINLEEISDEELLKHPIFVHSFTVCILAIFALAIYLLHFWLLYECWCWNRTLQKIKDASKSSRDSSIHQVSLEFTDSSDSSNQMSQRQSDSDNSFSFEVSDENIRQPIATVDHIEIKTVNDEPVILYCFCIDFWRYIQYRRNKRNNTPTQDVDIL